jgi:undecaprenyl-diphosphatase
VRSFVPRPIFELRRFAKAETNPDVRPLFRLLFFVLLAPAALAQRVTPPDPTTSTRVEELSAIDAITLGIVEGVTEFLPVSSTGHLIIANHFLKLESNLPLVDAKGQPLWYRAPSPENPAGEPMTTKLAADTYAVVIQFGAIAAVALLYWQRFLSMFRGLLGRDPAGLRLLVNVLVAFVPAAMLGLASHEWIDVHLFSVPTVIVALVAGALLMFYAEAWRRKRVEKLPEVRQADLSPRAVAIIGLLQCVAMWPGTSRSMMTIVGGYFAGLDPRRAAEFSFLLGFVTLSAASVFKSYKSGAAMIQVFGWSNVILGGLVAAVTAAVCVRFLVHWLTRHGLALFAWYRIALAAVLTVVFYL